MSTSSVTDQSVMNKLAVLHLCLMKTLMGDIAFWEPLLWKSTKLPFRNSGRPSVQYCQHMIMCLHSITFAPNKASRCVLCSAPGLWAFSDDHLQYGGVSPCRGHLLVLSKLLLTVVRSPYWSVYQEHTPSSCLQWPVEKELYTQGSFLSLFGLLKSWVVPG